MKKLLVLALILGVIGYGVYFVWQKYSTTKVTQFDTERVSEGPIDQVISTTGSLSALTTVDVGSQISGILATITVDFNSVVKAGQLLAQIDPSTYLAQEQQSLANIAGARAQERQATAQLENLESSKHQALADLATAKANREKSQASLTDAERAFKRAVDLFARKLIAAADRDSAETGRQGAAAAVKGSEAAIEAAQARLQAIEAQKRAQGASIEAAGAQIKQNEASLSMVRINLERTRIVSPIDGVVISRAVDVGQTVAASLQAPVLFSIANDLRKMQINTSVDEADIGKIAKGQSASFTVDAYPKRVYRGIVDQVRLAPTITQNVVTYAVMINVDNNDLTLLPGMTANVTIHVDRRDHVLRLPNKALYFKPPEDLIAQYGRWSSTDTVRIWKVDRTQRRRDDKDNGNADNIGSNTPGVNGERRRGPAAEGSGPAVGDESGAGSAGDEGSDAPRRWRRSGRGNAPITADLLVPVEVEVGLADSDYTEIVAGELNRGDQVVVGIGSGGSGRGGGGGGGSGSGRSPLRRLTRMR